MPTFVIESLVAGIVASFACGLGVVPLFIRGVNAQRHTGIAYGAAGGLMFAASVYNLILPGLTLTGSEIRLGDALPVIAGILLGALFLSQADIYLSGDRLDKLKRFGNKSQLLILIAMAVHSIPEGVAVGVGYASEAVYQNDLGRYVALAIAIHNIPEGLAVAVPLRATGASFSRCFWSAVFTSVPQPLAAVPAAYISWFFQPLMPGLMGFAAGAMIFLVLLELVPEALHVTSARSLSWSFTIGFCAMILAQVLL